ncbi:hypothetical protein D1N68_20645, partial [Clostridioides difficile]|uniref:glycine-rich protein n=1 Tax=Clostridioides difficile TaxID=1496 RepID=UPI0018F8CC69
RIIVAGGGGRNNFETKGGDGGGDAGGDGSKADSKGTQTNGGKVIPYKAGSVIPIKAEIPADNAVCFNVSSFVRKATAKQAPLS